MTNCEQGNTACGGGINFDGKPGMCFVQGEDVSTVITLFTPRVTTPIDLTDTQITLGLPRDGGGTVRRSTAPTGVPFVGFSVGSQDVVLPDHGFVTGDPVTVAAQVGGTLPAPLAPATTYNILVLDNDTFIFVDASGDEVIMTTQGTIGVDVTITEVSVTVANAVLGQVTLALSARVTAALKAGLAQSLQLQYVESAGAKTVVVVRNQLDIYAQPFP